MGCGRPPGSYTPCPYTACNSFCKWWYADCYSYTYTVPAKTLSEYTTDELLEEIKRRMK